MDYLSLVMSLNYTYLEFDFPTQYYWFYRELSVPNRTRILHLNDICNGCGNHLKPPIHIWTTRFYSIFNKRKYSLRQGKFYSFV